VVKKNREADTLSFPLYEPRSVNLTAVALTAKFEPKTELEMDITSILRESGIEEDEIKKYEVIDACDTLLINNGRC